MKKRVFVMEGKELEKKITVIESGEVVISMCVEGYGWVRDGKCAELVVGVEISSYEELERAMNDILNKGGREKSVDAFEALRMFGVEENDIQKIDRRYGRDKKANKEEGVWSEFIEVLEYRPWDQ